LAKNKTNQQDKAKLSEANLLLYSNPHQLLQNEIEIFLRKLVLTNTRPVDDTALEREVLQGR